MSAIDFHLLSEGRIGALKEKIARRRCSGFDSGFLLGEPGEQQQGALGVGSLGSGDKVGGNALRRHAEETREFGLRPMGAEVGPNGQNERVPKDGLWTGSQRLAATRTVEGRCLPVGEPGELPGDKNKTFSQIQRSF